MSGKEREQLGPVNEALQDLGGKEGNSSPAPRAGEGPRPISRRAGVGEESVLLTPTEVAREFGFLVVVSGRRTGSFFRLDRPRTLIGRSRRVQIYVDDPKVGGEHASIRCERTEPGGRGHFVLRDLDSETGTYLNGERVIAMRVLQDGDEIKVGETILTFKRV